MTEQEAIMDLQEYIASGEYNGTNPPIYLSTANISIKALEKQIPYKPQEYEDRYYACRCDNILLEKWGKYPTKLMSKSNGLPYCLACGQKIDWGNEYDKTNGN